MNKNKLNKYTNFFKLDNIKHFPPAVREWNNSVYCFNKNNANYSVVKYNQLNNLIKNYFNINDSLKLGRSKRIRYTRKISRTDRVYIGKPEIKQTNDNVTITIYCLDRHSQLLTRKLFYYNRPKIYDILEAYKKEKKMIRINKRIKYNIPLSGIKLIKEIKLFKENNKLKNKRLEQLTKFKFLKKLLSILGIHIIIPLYHPLLYFYEKNDKLRFSYLNESKLRVINYDMIITAIKSNPKAIYWMNHITNTMEKLEGKDINFNLIKKYLRERKYIKDNEINKKISYITPLNILTEINNKIWNVTYKYFYISDITSLKLYNNIFMKLREYSTKHIYKQRIKNMSSLTDLPGYRLFRFKTLLPTLKNFIDNLYNKRTKLNIVNLKYFYLNSDIFTQILISKIKKDIGAIKILKNSIYKIRTYPWSSNIKKVNMFNSLKFLSLRNSLSLKKLPNNILSEVKNKEHDFSKLYKQFITDESRSLNNKYIINKQNNADKLDNIFNELYSNDVNSNIKVTNELHSRENKKFIFYKNNNVISMIKYKWLLGIWVEAKGRLTRRNTAARSVLNTIFKGSLKDRDNYTHLNRINNIPTFVLNNSNRSNTDYTSKGSIKRIGTFGIKTWISTK